MKKIVGQCVQVTLNYGKADVTNKTATPIFTNILLEDIVCEYAALGPRWFAVGTTCSVA